MNKPGHQAPGKVLKFGEGHKTACGPVRRVTLTISEHWKWLGNRCTCAGATF
ncbi:MAG: hypothetical protein HWD62_10175 [Cyclobacteriaceae bacterium]|nr:MAG: hypothetical protein HWD62_10175 [Cyclobacteriaceae bacterium]